MRCCSRPWPSWPFAASSTQTGGSWNRCDHSGDGLALSTEAESRHTRRSSNFIPKHISARKGFSPRGRCRIFIATLFISAPNLEATPNSIDSRTDQNNCGILYSGILCNKEKGRSTGNTATHEFSRAKQSRHKRTHTSDPIEKGCPGFWRRSFPWPGRRTLTKLCV